MKKILSYMLAYLPMMLLLVGCSEAEKIDDSPSKKMTVIAQMPESGTTRAELSVSENSLNLLAKWQANDKLKIILIQGDQKFDVGEVPIANISSNGKSASFSYTIPTDLDLSKKYKLYAFCGIDGYVEKNTQGNWYAHCTPRLIRTEISKFKAPLVSLTEITYNNPVVQFEHFETYEVLHVKNASSSLIHFRHEGFNVDNPWYQGVPNLYDFETWNPGNLPSGWNTDAMSETVDISSRGAATIISCYLPSGYKMQDAYLKAAINGALVVSANKKSSDVTVERAHAYHQYVTWDGSELTFDNGDPMTQMIIDVTPLSINFGSVDYGSSKTETFVVSNVGTADLTFSVQTTNGDFSIAESGKKVFLPVGAQKAIDVVFKPRQANTEYYETVQIYTDAINGNQTLTLYGKSGQAKSKKISVSPLTIDFGTIAVDEGRSETFTVSNVGEDQLTFKVASTSGVFTISDSGKSFTLGTNQKKTFTVVFKPATEETTYNQTVDITSDAENGTQYLTLTGQSEKKRIEQVIPPDIRDRMDGHITIYDGSNPPNIEGDYMISPALLSYDSDNDFNIGYQFNDTYIRFLNQDMINNTLDYQEKQSSSTTTGEGCFISGEGDNFSVFFNTDGVGQIDYTTHFKTALVISGTKTSSGIQNLEYAFVMVYKDYDPMPYYMDEGDFRVIIDGDGMAYYSPWSYAPKWNARSAKKSGALPFIIRSGKLADIKK